MALNSRVDSKIFEKFRAAQAAKKDVKTLDLLPPVIQDTSTSGLGVTEPVPLMAAKKYFPEELAAHLRGECPAGQCKRG